MSDSKIIDILISHQDIFSISDIFSTAIRFLLWGLVKILAVISNGLENIIDKIYTLNGFFASKAIVDLFEKLSPIIWILLAISIIFIGFRIMYDREFKKEKLIQNILVAIVTIVMLPTLMIKLSDATKYGVKALDEVGGSKVNYSANKVIKDNLYDLYYLDNFNFTNKNAKNNINEKYIDIININETIDKSKTKNKDLFSNTIDTSLDGKLTLRKLDSSLFGLMKEEYYRFSINYLPVIVTLICTIVALLSTSFKTSRIIYELAFVGIFARLLAFSDIGNGQKVKEVVKHIINTFIVLFFIALILKVYLLFSTWLNDNTSLNMITKMVILIGASIGVVDGPNIVERILGIDSGIKSGWSVVMGGVATSKAISSTATTLGAISKQVGSKVNNISSMFGANSFKNNSKSSSSLEQEMSSKSNNDNISNMSNKNENSNLHSQMKNSDIANEKLSRKNASNDVSVNSSNNLNSNISENTSNSNNLDSQSNGDNSNISNNSNINSNDDNNLFTNSNIEMSENDSISSDLSINDNNSISNGLSISENDKLNSSTNSLIDMNNSEILSNKSDFNTGIKDNVIPSNQSIHGIENKDKLNKSIIDNTNNPIDISSKDNNRNKSNIVGNRNHDILNPSIYGLQQQKINKDDLNKSNIKPSNDINNTKIGNTNLKPNINENNISTIDRISYNNSSSDIKNINIGQTNKNVSKDSKINNSKTNVFRKSNINPLNNDK